MSCLMNNNAIGDCVIEQRMLGLEMTPLILMFFSRRNVDLLHQAIIDNIILKVGTRIGRQDEKALLQVMRGTFLEDARYANTRLAEQTDVLNGRVLQFCIPNITQAIEAQDRNNKDVFNNPVPIGDTRAGIATNNKGENSLEFKSFF